METPKTSLAMLVARGVSVAMAVAAMTAFVVLEHRRLNRTGTVSAEANESTGDEIAGTSVLDIELEPVATEDTEADNNLVFEFSVAPVRIEMPAVNFDLPAAQVHLPPPALIPPKTLHTLVIGSESDVYMMSSKSIVVVPEKKKPKRPAAKP